MILQNSLKKVNTLKNFFKILGRKETDREILSTGIDNKYQKKPEEETINISEIQKFFEEKTQEQKIKQFGVFFCPNTIVNTRGNDNVVKINALFCDIDVKDQKQETKNIILDRILNSNICPSIIIKTKSGFHCYWLTNEISLEEFDRYQNALHEYINKNFLSDLLNFDPKKNEIVTVVCDPKAKAKSCLLRVPFFLHMKDKNNPLEIVPIKLTDKKFSLDFFKNILVISENSSETKDLKENSAIIKLKERREKKETSGLSPILTINIQDVIMFIKEQFGFDSNNKNLIDPTEFFYTLNRLDIRHALCIPSKGTKSNIKCFFHKDNQPSASIFRGQDGVWFYKCHSSNCKMEMAMTNFDLICNIFNISKFQLLKEIEKRLDVCFNVEYALKVQEIVKNNKHFLSSSARYSMLCRKLVDKTRSILFKIIDMISNNVVTDELEIDGRPGMFISMDYLSKVTKIEKRSAHRILCYLCAIGFLRKERWNKIPESFKPKTIKHSQYDTQITYISLPRYSKGYMVQCDNDTKKLHDGGIISPRAVTMWKLRYSCGGKYFSRCFDEHFWSISMHIDNFEDKDINYYTEKDKPIPFTEEGIYQTLSEMPPNRKPRGSSLISFLKSNVELDFRRKE